MALTGVKLTFVVQAGLELAADFLPLPSKCRCELELSARHVRPGPFPDEPSYQPFFLFFFFLIFEAKAQLCSPGWPGAQDPSSAAGILWLSVWYAMLGFFMMLSYYYSKLVHQVPQCL